jgi:hypothetical protein
VQAPSGWVTRDGAGFRADAARDAAEPFHLQATDLGSYLLWSADQRFLAAAGSGVTAASTPSPEADFVVDDAFTLVLSGGRALQADGAGALSIGATPTRFTFTRTTGCATWPEVEINITGEPVGGSTPWTEVAGYLDAHLHTMAFEFVGGNARCGRPWHRYGVDVRARRLPRPRARRSGRGAGARAVRHRPGAGPRHRRLADLRLLAQARLAHPRAGVPPLAGAGLARRACG